VSFRAPTGALLALAVTAAAEAAAQPCRSPAETRRFVPDYAKLQTGGYLGAFTLGAGYTPLGNALDFAGYYGWVPSALGGVDIHTVALRVGARVRGVCLSRDWNWVYLTGGAGALLTFGEDFFVFVPERYDNENYYRPTALRGIVSLGTELSRREHGSSWISTEGVFLEVTALDEYVRLMARSPRSESFVDTLSTTLGFRLGFL
jgi:hypothetical protein